MENTFFRMLQSTETDTVMDNGTTTTDIQNTTQTDNTIARNKTQIVLGYQLNILKIVSNPGLPWNVILSKGQKSA